MGKYYLHDGAYLMQVGSCPDGQEKLQAREGAVLELGDPPLSFGYPPLPVTSAAANRAAAYPSVGDQLDALWAGGSEAVAMKKLIDDVKKKYSKTGAK